MHQFISRHIKTVFVSLCSLGARVQSDRGVLQEALPDWAAATWAGAGTPGRAGPETLGPVHPEDSNGQTLSGRSLCHQGSPTRLHRSAVSQGKILLKLFGAAASGNNTVLMNAGNVPNGSESVIWPLLSTTKCCQTTAKQQACQVQDWKKMSHVLWKETTIFSWQYVSDLQTL